MRSLWYWILSLFGDVNDIQAHIDLLAANGGGWVDLRGREFLLPKLRIPANVRVIASPPSAIPLLVILLVGVSMAIWSLLR